MNTSKWSSAGLVSYVLTILVIRIRRSTTFLNVLSSVSSLYLLRLTQITSSFDRWYSAFRLLLGGRGEEGRVGGTFNDFPNLDHRGNQNVLHGKKPVTIRTPHLGRRNKRKYSGGLVRPVRRDA